MPGRPFPVADWAPVQDSLIGADNSKQFALPTDPDKFHAMEPDNGPQPAMPSSSRQPKAPESRVRRSLSFSFGRRPRPKSGVFNADEAVSRLPGLVLEDGEDSADAPPQTQQGGGSEVGMDGPGKGKSQIKGMIRRASVSLKQLVPRRATITAGTGEDHHTHRRFLRSAQGSGSFSGGEGLLFRPTFSFSNQPETARPTTAHSSTWQRLRQAASFRNSRGNVLETIESPRSSHFFGGPVPGSGAAPPVIPPNTGNAARAAAADAAMQADALRWLGPAEWTASEAGGSMLGAGSGSGGRPAYHTNGPYHSNDGESGIGITVTATESEEEREKADSRLGFVRPGGSGSTDHLQDSALLVGGGGGGGGLAFDHQGHAQQQQQPADGGIPRVDFVAQLPLELAIEILAYLDGPDLATVERVSRAWRHVTTYQHIWRESFLRGMTTTFATSGPVKPGAGLGVPPVRPGGQWKDIYRAKVELDKRWKAGAASPVYLNGHTDSIYCLQFDESKIITGSRDKTIRVWDIHTLSCLFVIGPPDVVRDQDLVFDRDGNPTHFATTETSPRASPSIPSMLTFPNMHHNASILCLQYDDRILVTGSSDATCIVHSISGGYRPIKRLQGHSAAVLDLCFDDRYIVTCSKDVSICVWDRETGALVRQLRGHAGPVNAVQMRGDAIVSCSGDFKVKLWNISTGKCIREFAGHTKGLACSQFSEDGRYVASAGNDRTIRVWDANTGECVREVKAHENLVRSLHIDSVSGRLVSGSYDTDIMVFDMETGRQLLHFPRWHASWVLSAKSDYRRIISTGQDPKILVMDFGKGVRGIEMLESCMRRRASHGGGCGDDDGAASGCADEAGGSAQSPPPLSPHRRHILNAVGGRPAGYI
ncbi:hypothetical protein GGTG_02177 [Gaeumannomyces tritici R3-111a-1]|uniref:F-box domain-containing protein n=1 Tax=Gaeumannomyces tritici (strain R3-111a-1) TaxID=644352 RepID=J3NLM8_GAET3|nr:hypothetical protein GGTG_02177 [Gaeumannomyces tritici R3-111a-1]EJT82203.1 hypothetical protein GGTG_02177 [Gaeumannomyces tritici R3-111a-1]